MIAYWSGRLTPAAVRLWPLAALAAVALAIAGVGDRPLLLLGVTVTLAAVAALWIDQRLVVPFIILLLPLEISRAFFPFFYSEGHDLRPGIQVSVVDLARLGMLLVAAWWAVTARSRWSETIPTSSLLLPLLLLSALYLVSLSYTLDVSTGLKEIVRLPFHLAFFLLIPYFIRDRRGLRWCFWALIGTGLVLGLLGIYQKFQETYFVLWNPTLLSASTTRVNATFADPNLFARFLVVVIVMSLSLLVTTRLDRRRLLLLATMGTCTLALLFTGSRSGWLTAALVLPIVALLLPLKASYKAALLTTGSAIVIAGLTVLLFFDNALAQRFETFQLGLRAISERYYLIQAGWQMSLDNPLSGVGLGGFEKAMLGPYRHFIWPGYTVTLSHTSLVTIIAELGILGLLVLAFLLLRCWGLMLRLYRLADTEAKVITAGLTGALLAIFISSQAEGRLFEDPYLWLILGLAVAIEHVSRKEAKEKHALTSSPESQVVVRVGQDRGSSI